MMIQKSRSSHKEYLKKKTPRQQDVGSSLDPKKNLLSKGSRYRENYEDAHLIVKNLWLGNIKAARDKDFLRENNIRFVLNCTKDIPNYYEQQPWGPSYYRIPVDDSLLKKDFIVMTDYLFHVIPYLSIMLSKGITILIHCYAGMQRSACVVAALLVRHRLPLHQAIQFIQNRRKVAFTPQVNFIDSLLLYTLNNQ